MRKETIVLIVGAGPAGLATSACLNLQNIPNIILEKEDCYASLWKKRSYDRLKLHLAKQFCQLPLMPFSTNAPTFVPRNDFIKYLDSYVPRFNINPFYHRVVNSASYDVINKRWIVVANNLESNIIENYVAKFLVVATGENNDGFIPEIPGMDTFDGEAMHSSQYKNGKSFYDKNVLVVGCGNSGMEIAYDLSNWGAKTSIVVHNPVHVLTKEMVHLGMTLLKFIPCTVVDIIMLILGKIKYGNLSDYGLQRPNKGPFFLKETTGRSPVIDVGTVDQIIGGQIKVLPSLKDVNGRNVEFSDGEVRHFDVIVFATGYRSLVRKWLKDDGGLFNEDGTPKKRKPDHWKGENGLYCAGFSRSGLFGISNDAKNIAEDIHSILEEHHGGYFFKLK